jgi:hypothetical protein
MVKIASFRESGPRYPSLRIIGSLWTLLGVIVMVSGGLAIAVIGYFAIAARDVPAEPSLRVATGIYALWAFCIAISGLQLIALGALYRLMIHMEENTRASAQALETIRDRLEGNPADLAPIFRS